MFLSHHFRSMQPFHHFIMLQMKIEFATTPVYIFIIFCYIVYDQCQSFIYLDLMVQNSEISIERWISIKLV
jgi:hypothetical protein